MGSTARAVAAAALVSVAAALGGVATAFAIDPAGGVGGGAIAGSVTVTVIDARTLAPVSGAFCQIGPAPGVPFANNLVLTNASGVATFANAALYGPQTVTVGKANYHALTIFNVNASQMILPIGLRGQQIPKALYQGSISGFTLTSNDGQFDVAITMPALSISDLTSIANFGEFAPVVVEEFPLVGDQPILGNIYLPLQVEFLFIPVERTPYFLYLENQTTQDIFTFYGRIPTSTLLDGLGSDDPSLLPLIQDFEMRKYGIAENVVVNGPATRNLTLPNNATNNLRVRVANTAPGTDVFVFGAADLDGLAGLGRIVPSGFDGLVGGGAPSVLTVATIVSGGDFVGQNYLAGALQSDTAAVALANSFVVDRRGLSPGDTAIAQSFMRPPMIESGGAFLSWTSLENPGISPAADAHFASLDLVKVIPDTNPGAEPGDTLEIPTSQWQFILPASANSFAIPTLGPAAPQPITNPATTTDNDRLDWGLSGAALELAPSFNYNSWDLIDRARLGTNIAWNAKRNIPYPYTPTTDVPIADAPPVERMLGEPAPNPFRDVTSIAFDLSRVTGAVRLEVFDVAGRRVRLLLDGVPSGERAEAQWDGANDFGEPMPAGSYFFRLDASGRIDSKKVVKAK
ncbi:MAG: FlgD immunoglobulin-like domain containing protein [bacterium]